MMATPIRVLLVEDEPALLEVIKESLEAMAPIEVTTSCRVDDALEVLKRRTFEAIVSDYQMPERDGLDLLNEVRRTYPSLPFILFTGKGREEVVIEALNRGADFYLQKGGDPKCQFTELIHMIRKAVSTRNAEHSLRESDSRYRSLVQNLKGIVYKVRFSDRMPEMFEGEVESLTGYRPEEFTKGGVVWESLVLPEDRTVIWETINAEGYGKGSPFDIRYRIRRRNGEVAWVNEVGHCTVDEGRPVNVFGMICDITRKEMLESDLRNSEARWKFALEGAGDGIWDYDLKARRIYFSPRYRSILGLDADEQTESPNDWLERIHPENREKVMTEMTELMKNDTVTCEIEHPLRCKDGSYKWIRARGMVAERDENGAPTRLIGTHLDITRLKENEMALQAQMAEMNIKKMALQDSEEMFRAFIEESSDAIVLIDEDGKVIEWNGAEETITGIERQKAIGSKYLDLIVPLMLPEHARAERVERMRAILEEAVRTGRSDHFHRTYEIEITGAGGKRHVLQQVAFSIRVRDGVKLGSISRDITDQRAIERELVRSEEVLRTIINSSYDAIFIHDTYGKVLEVNDRLLEMYHIRRDEAIGLTIRDFSDERFFDEQAKTRIWDNVLAGQSFFFPWKAKRPTEGSTFDVEVYLTSIMKGDRRLILATTRDVTERKRADKALGEAEEKYRLLVQNIHEIIFTIRPDGIITYASPSWTALMGYDMAEYVGSDFSIVILEEDRRICREFLRRTVDTLTEQPSIEYRVVRKDGGVRWHRTHLSPILDEKGDLASLIGSVVDITEYKMAVEALAFANKKLNLLSSITRHDIINQIMAAQGNIELAKMIKDDQDKLRYCERIERLVKTIQRQIEFTREYEQLGEKEPVWLSISYLVDKARDDRVHIVDGYGNAEVFADPMIETVFRNLMDNTIRHGEGVTKVTVSCHATDEGATVVWEDDGCGVPEEQKEHIFDRGFGKNTGLGLFLAREILGITGITIVENGTAGKGARFEMSVPETCFRKKT